MSFGGKLARGLLQGASNYYGKVAENQEYDRRAEALMAREAALSRLKTQEAMALSTHQGKITQENTRAELDIRGQLAAQDDERTAARTLIELKEKFRQEWALMTEKERLGMTREQYVQSQLNARQSREIALARETREDTQAHEDTTKPIATMTNERGEVVQGFGSGNVRTYRDSRPTPSSRSDDGDRLPPRVTAAPSATPAPDFSQFNQMLSEAAMHPDFKGKSATQIRAEIIALAKRNGIPAPAR